MECRSVTRSYYRGALGCLLVYDITNRESYNHVPMWLQDARTLATNDLVVVLVGNKCDLQNDREVAFLEASKFAQENGKSYSIITVSRFLYFFLSFVCNKSHLFVVYRFTVFGDFSKDR
jgi:GTPase SAR1 family protein